MNVKKRAGGETPSVRAVPSAAADAPTAEQLLLEKKIKAAKRVITIERLWPRVWPPLAVCILFVLASGFGLWPLLSPEMHRAVLYGFGVALVLSFIPLLLMRRVTREEAIARLQKTSAIPHRPITAYTDTLTQPPGPESGILWQAHRQRVAALLGRLRSGPPQPRVDRYDPIALRAALILLLAVVIAWQWTGLRKQVEAAFIVPAINSASGLRVDGWVTPPAYTRKAPFVLASGELVRVSGEALQPVEAPEGSTVTFKVNHEKAGEFGMVWRSEDAVTPLQRDEKSGGSFAAFSTKLNSSGVLALQRGGQDVQTWPIQILDDGTPEIGFTGPIEISQRSALLFKYAVKDDYGVIAAEAQIERVENGIAPGESAGGAGDATSLTPKAPSVLPRLGKPPVFPLTLPAGSVKEGEGKTYRDLTAHPWAGLPVIVTLVAKDEAGQTGMSAPRGFILPERKFTKPLARALIEQRKSLVENPARTKNAMMNLDALGRWAESEEIAPSIYLGMRSVYWRLHNDQSIETVEGVVDQLWDLAVKIEDGDLPDAERDLRAAQQRLMEALKEGASPEEIDRLMAELRQSLNKFLQALAEQQQRNQGQQAATPPPGGNEKSVTSNELQQLLNKIEDLAKLGSQDMAQQLLSELQDILENLQTGQQGNMDTAEQQQRMQQLDELGNLMREQQKLLDETMRAQQDAEMRFGRDPYGQPEMRGQQQRGQRGEKGGTPSPQELQERQQALQEKLRELLEQMGKQQGQQQGQQPGQASGQGENDAQQRLQDAERAMGNAGDALGGERLGEATNEETQALDALRQGARAMAEQMMGQQGNRNGRGQASRDPLGRQNRGQNDPGDSVKVPEEIDIQRAREILDELRRRAGEPTRPALELDYIERLIKRF